MNPKNFISVSAGEKIIVTGSENPTTGYKL